MNRPLKRVTPLDSAPIAVACFDGARLLGGPGAMMTCCAFDIRTNASMCAGFSDLFAFGVTAHAGNHLTGVEHAHQIQ